MQVRTPQEQIQRLKARYFRLMDTKQWSAFRELFTDDCRFFLESDEVTTATGDDFVAFVTHRLGAAVTVHHGHMPEIDVAGDGTASGTWAMFDWVDDPANNRAFQGFGHYHDRFRLCDDGEWRICEVRLSRLRVDRLEPSRGGVRRDTPVPSTESDFPGHP